MKMQHDISARNILVTGGGGYLGAVLVPLLLQLGHRVQVLDCFYFGEESLTSVKMHPGLTIVREDIFHQENIPNLLQGVDAIIHLASLSNDPSCDLDPNLSIRTNFLATVALARRAKMEGVRQFIFASSCSVYGAGGHSWLDETSQTGPVTLYALSKLECEHELLQCSSSDFQINIVRFATLFGLSPRMRFDLAVNVMTKRALQGQNIIVNGAGNQYRPFVHVRDAADALLTFLQADPQITAGQIFNVGGDHLNYTIADLASEIHSVFPEIRIASYPQNDDMRSYKVSFEKVCKLLGVIPQRTILDGVNEISRAYHEMVLTDMDDEQFYNVMVMKNMHRKSILTPSLASAPRWTNVVPPSEPTSSPIGMSLTAQQFSTIASHRNPKVVAMILAYNCAQLLPRAYEKIPQELVDDIIVMDDGSRDGTYEVAQRLGVQAFRHTPNRGYGGNVKAGLKKALELGADYIVEVHGDGGQFHPAAIADAIPYMQKGMHFIVGSRFHHPKRALENGMPYIRFAANRFLSFFDRLVLELPLSEFHTGFRIYSKTMLEHIPFEHNSDDYLFSFQIIAQAAYYNMQVAEVPVEADYHNEHTSHKLSGAALYALQTFGVLGTYLLAKRGYHVSRVFSPQGGSR